MVLTVTIHHSCGVYNYTQHEAVWVLYVYPPESTPEIASIIPIVLGLTIVVRQVVGDLTIVLRQAIKSNLICNTLDPEMWPTK